MGWCKFFLSDGQKCDRSRRFFKERRKIFCTHDPCQSEYHFLSCVVAASLEEAPCLRLFDTFNVNLVAPVDRLHGECQFTCTNCALYNSLLLNPPIDDRLHPPLLRTIFLMQRLSYISIHIAWPAVSLHSRAPCIS